MLTRWWWRMWRPAGCWRPRPGRPRTWWLRSWRAGADFHFVVHNAAGMVSVQEQISVTEALICLRAFAFSHDRLLAEVAGDVVARRLRLG